MYVHMLKWISQTDYEWLNNNNTCLFSVIIWVRVVFRKTAGGNDWCFNYLSGSHLQSQVNRTLLNLSLIASLVVCAVSDTWTIPAKHNNNNNTIQNKNIVWSAKYCMYSIFISKLIEKQTNKQMKTGLHQLKVHVGMLNATKNDPQ